MPKKKQTLLVPGTDAWKSAVSVPLPPVGHADTYEAPAKTPKSKKAPRPKKVKPWKPDYKDPFYSFERRIVQVISDPPNIIALADDGSLWSLWLARDGWNPHPALPRRMMKPKESNK